MQKQRRQNLQTDPIHYLTLSLKTSQKRIIPTKTPPIIKISKKPLKIIIENSDDARRRVGINIVKKEKKRRIEN